MKFQIKVLAQKRIHLKAKLFDIGIAHYLLNPDMRHDLSIITENYLQYSILTLGELLGKGKLKKSM